MDPTAIIRLIQAQPRVYKLDGQDKLKINLELPGATERIGAAQDLLGRLGARKPA